MPANAAAAFGRAAPAYERTRPSYPEPVVGWLCEQTGVRPGATAVDLAAGTGKLTRLLVPCGARLVAVEPVAEMRAELERRLPSVEVRAGRAEALPLEDDSVDAVLAAQAFHWFDAPAALDELARVLHGGGGLGIVFNAWDLEDPLQARLDTLIRRHAPQEPGDTVLRPIPYTSAAHAVAPWRQAFPHPAFTPMAERVHAWTQLLPASELRDRISTVSVIAALPADAQQAALEEVQALSATLAQEVELAYRTLAYACRRRPR